MTETNPYIASKGVLRSLSKSTAVEYVKDLIITVHSGINKTPMTAPFNGACNGVLCITFYRDD